MFLYFVLFFGFRPDSVCPSDNEGLTYLLTYLLMLLLNFMVNKDWLTD